MDYCIFLLVLLAFVIYFVCVWLANYTSWGRAMAYGINPRQVRYPMYACNSSSSENRDTH